MPDLSATWDIPNPYGLVAGDFGHDLTGYRVALGFLGDLATGSSHEDALALNGGDQAMVVGWNRSDKFRRVYAKCRAAGLVEQEAVRARVSAAAATEKAEAASPQGQRFVRLEDVPVQRSVFSQQASRDSWGAA